MLIFEQTTAALSLTKDWFTFIKNTPIPYSYSVFIKKIIFFYIMTLPFGYVFQLGFYVIPVVPSCFMYWQVLN